MQNAFKADIIHLASHAKINHKTPELSYFSFSNDDIIANIKTQCNYSSNDVCIYSRLDWYQSIH